MNLLDPRYLVKKRRYLRKHKRLTTEDSPHTVRFMGRQFDLLMHGVRDHRVCDYALAVWYAAGFPSA